MPTEEEKAELERLRQELLDRDEEQRRAAKQANSDEARWTPGN